ncbi:MAG: hypothetical protein CUN49_08035 [Candidatus Thermofonsia Clade 1 bacterium]|uniref:Uncharacterized protein n=1 Tax=Candidatus Thermofonsia Clade 1 bacterium TaxID=2364210 RepID=A0A2M8PEE7_9CHLR|nr:MAG: hypothetical protein CUN49_08035 [Candidatus Thermofonsia Clade 1 bacterium]RMF52853.1 MAG: hypothetical protein D6749_03845 [Chloroflexota bacterium]
MNQIAKEYDEAQQLTAISLRRYLDTTDQLTHLSLPELQSLADEIARIVPAGNVPTMISIGLANLRERVVPVQETRRNLALLMQGMQTFVDKVKYSAIFGGPAAILAAYHMLLRLTGKDPIKSFPEGTWQFYVEFGLREDTAWHACETVGFHQALQREGAQLEPADELAAWIMAAAWLLQHYSELLACEWTERVQLRVLGEALGEPRLVDQWLKIRPYSAPSDEDIFIAYRRQQLEQFCAQALERARRDQRRAYERAWQDRRAVAERQAALQAYINQMDIRAALTPSEYNDTRTPIPPNQLHIGVIVRKRYYLIPLRNAAEHARAIAAELLALRPSLPVATLDRALRTARRREQPALRRALPESARQALEQLRTAPILINWDMANADDRLTDIRSGQRGIGDHALTIFRTARSNVFDLSHIFFDAANGMATAEILTGQAARFVRLLAAQRLSQTPAQGTAYLALNLEAPSTLTPAKLKKIQCSPEVSAENRTVRLELIQDVRRSLLKRSDKLRLTVNDLLLLYRTVFNPLYKPDRAILDAIIALSQQRDKAVQAAVQLVTKTLDSLRQSNPALLIPIDATAISPHERIFPTTFRNPMPNIYEKHRQTYQAFRMLEQGALGVKASEAQAMRLEYLGMLQKFGEVLLAYKDVTMRGESLSTSTIRLLGGLPPAVQRLLDSLPSHFDMLNDTIKGQEVFSNVGQVAATSSLRRFNTAKDDNEKKMLAWGIMTDATGVLHLSLRDFRPHVAALIGIGERDLAQAMAQDYLDKFAQGFNAFMEELLYIARARGR